MQDTSSCLVKSDYIAMLQAADSAYFGEKPFGFSLKKAHAAFALFVEALQQELGCPPLKK